MRTKPRVEQVAHIANTILYQAKKEGVAVSIMKLQKLTYLLYSDFLHCAGQALFSERFEAWRYGPVLNSIQTAFMNCKPDHMNGYMVDAKGGRKITTRDQRVAAEILTQFMFTKNMEDVMNVWKEVHEHYGLCDDPFTGTPCTPEEYCQNRVEYEKQTMIEKYGHCDGYEGM